MKHRVLKFVDSSTTILKPFAFVSSLDQPAVELLNQPLPKSKKPVKKPRRKPEHAINVEEILSRGGGTPVIYQNTRFGAAQVLMDDIVYAFKCTQQRVSHYRCSQFKQYKCPAQVIVKEGLVYYGCKEHNHDKATGKPLDDLCGVYQARGAKFRGDP